MKNMLVTQKVPEGRIGGMHKFFRRALLAAEIITFVSAFTFGNRAFGQKADSSLRDSTNMRVPVRQDSVLEKKLENVRLSKGFLFFGNDSMDLKNLLYFLAEDSNYSENRNTVKIEARQEGIGKVFCYVFGCGVMMASWQGGGMTVRAVTYEYDANTQWKVVNGTLVNVASDGTVSIFNAKGGFWFNCKEDTLAACINNRDSLIVRFMNHPVLIADGDNFVLRQGRRRIVIYPATGKYDAYVEEKKPNPKK